MKKPIVYTNEPIRIGKIVGKDILPGHGGSRRGAGRPASGNKPITLRLPPSLIGRIRREARRSGQTISQFVANKLGRI
jgi:hypothetical protein